MTLTRTHLSPNTGKRERCEASVRECRFGGHEVVNFDATSMAEFYAEVPAAAYANISHPAIHRALTTDLAYSGPKPSWWDKQESEVVNHPTLPSRLELLDVIDTPVGKVTVVWQEISHAENDKGVIVDSGSNISTYRYLDWESGADLGYVKLSYRDKDTLTRSFGTDEFAPFRYKQRFGGGNLALRDYDSDDDGPSYLNLTGEELLAKRRQVWLRIHQYNRSSYVLPDGERIASYQISEKHIPDDETVEKDLKAAAKDAQKEINSNLKTSATPFVDYSRVEGPLANKGYGSSLYIYAARHLAQRNQVLRGSGLQSDEAQGVWSRFKKNIPQHVKQMTVRYHGETSKAPTLDFRA